MAEWTSDELDRIGAAEELRIASLRQDGTLGGARTIWAVRHGDDVYVRSYMGDDAAWYRQTQVRHAGHVEAGGVARDVTFEDVDGAVGDGIDAAYREKYGRFGPRFIDSMVSPRARAATLRLTPR